MKIRKKAEKAIDKAIDKVFEEIESASPYDLPELIEAIEAIAELRKLTTNRLRIFLFGFGTCFASVVAYHSITRLYLQASSRKDTDFGDKA